MGDKLYQLKLYMLLLALGVLINITIHAQVDDVLLVAWVQDGDLYMWQDGTTQPLDEDETTTIIQIAISPDGSHIAYHGDSAEGSGTYVIATDADTDITDRTRILQAPAAQFLWADQQTLYFSTYDDLQVNQIPELSETFYRYDVSSDTLTEFTPGGQLEVNPEGETILVIDAGIYGEAEGAIHLLHDNREPLLTFPAVATASHYAFYPLLDWIGADTALVALPDADLIYADPRNLPPTELWRVSITEQAQQIGTVSSSFFGLPRWSSAGTWLVYGVTEPPDRFSIYVANGDGTDARLYVEGSTGQTSTPQWIDDQRFLYAHDDATWIGTPDSEPTRWLDAFAIEPQIVGDYAVYVTFSSAGVGIAYAELSIDNAQSETIIESGNISIFDAVIIQQ